jgi:hypothetical protein
MAIVYKTSGSEALDEYYSGNQIPLVNALRDGLNLMRSNPNQISGAARPLEARGQLPQNSADDLDNYWLAGPSGAATERLIRHGYEHAISLANASTPPKPIETFVVAGAATDFEIHLCEGKHAVTVFLFVTDDRTYGSRRAGSRSWVVSTSGPREHPWAQHIDLEEPPAVKLQVSGA